jgi:hypothetical protein
MNQVRIYGKVILAQRDENMTVISREIDSQFQTTFTLQPSQIHMRWETSYLHNDFTRCVGRPQVCNHLR